MARKNFEQINYQIVRHLGVVAHGSKGWSTQVNLVSWNDNPVVLDIRSWNYDQTKFGKGITFSADEASRLNQIISSLGLNPVEPLHYPEQPEESIQVDKGFGFAQY